MSAATTTRPSLRVRPPVLGALTLAVVIVAVTWWHRSSAPIRTESVACLSADGVISCDLADGWTTSVPLDVAWTDADGSFHESGRPECLPPTGIGLEDPVQVTWTPVEADGVRWRQVVWVGC